MNPNPVALSACVVGILVGWSGGPTAAAAPQSPKPVIVVVKALHDAGGLGTVTANGDAINLSYTQAIRHYLTIGGYVVVDRAAKGDAASFSVEGDLSHLGINDIGDGPYLCVLRLFSESGKHTLVGQWAGVARSLRYLTANLNETEGVDSEGLLGELGGKIAETIRIKSDATGAATFAAIVAAGSQPDVIDAFPVVASDPAPHVSGAEAIGQPEPPPPGQVVAGSSYRLHVRSPEAGTVILVSLGADGEPESLLTHDPSHPFTLVADKAVLIPAGAAITIPATEIATDHKIVVLLRRASAPPAHGSSDSSSGESGSDLPVRILDDTTPAATPTASKPEIEHLLQAICADPSGAWMAHTVVLHVVPKSVP